jgi:hypothetical protein
MVKFRGTENLLDVLTKGANHCNDGFIAVTHHSAIVYIALSNPKIWAINLQLIHLLFLESLQIQSLQPFD